MSASLLKNEIVCSASLNGAGIASCAGAIFTAANHNLVAYYQGDSNYDTALSVSWAVSVTKASTTTTIQSHSPNPSLVNTAVTFTATVDNVSPGNGTPYGSVTFSDLDNVNVCVSSSAPWPCNIIFPFAEPHLVTASYSRDGNFINSVSTSITQDVLTGVDSEFLNVIGPDSPFVVSTTRDCLQTYSVKVLDIDGITDLKVEYSFDDITFTTPTLIPLSNGGSGDIWSGNFFIPGAVTQTGYWRFIGLDIFSNYTFFGAGVPYTNDYPDTGVSSYFFNFLVACP